jgi:hypothetical protein
MRVMVLMDPVLLVADRAGIRGPEFAVLLDLPRTGRVLGAKSPPFVGLGGRIAGESGDGAPQQSLCDERRPGARSL